MILSSHELQVLYETILSLIREYRTARISDCTLAIPSYTIIKNGFNHINEGYDLCIDYDTFVSYFNQICLRLWRKSKYMYDDNVLSSIVNDVIYKQRDIIDICRQYQCSSYKISKFILERLSDYPVIVNHSHKLLQSSNGTTKRSFSINEFLEYPDIIKETRLQNAMIEGICNDLLCSPFQDQIKECVGKEYEGKNCDCCISAISKLAFCIVAMLSLRLQSLRMVFETEADLRNKGKAKTPDILFLIPMMITYTLRNSRGDIIQDNIVASNINWIDSKAVFADKEIFEEHKEEQFQGYISRYGRGMVIYWHGFVDSIIDDMDIISDIESLVVIDHFPEEWRYPTGEVASTDNQPAFMSFSSWKYSARDDKEMPVEEEHNRLIFSRTVDDEHSSINRILFTEN